jgi:hypothetical protein
MLVLRAASVIRLMHSHPGCAYFYTVDTMLHNSVGSVMDMLWACTPVLGYAGERATQRFTASALTAANKVMKQPACRLSFGWRDYSVGVSEPLLEARSP